MTHPTASGDAPTERRLRTDIAVCTRLMNLENVLGYSGHVSARLPGSDRFLIQSFDQSRAALSPDDLLICDADGRPCAGPAGKRPPSEIHLHTEIFRARADIHAVAHFHHDLTNVFTVVEGVCLVPLKNHAIRWRSGIPVHPDPSHVDSAALGRKLADRLGSHQALLIRAHGQVVVAEDVRSLLVDTIHFVENAQALYQAMAIGKAMPLTDGEMDDFAAGFSRRRHVPKVWDYYLSLGRKAGVIPDGWALG